MLRTILFTIQHSISIIGVLIILCGVLKALYEYINYLIKQSVINEATGINTIRLSLGRSLVLGLEFIVAADLIGTTTTPDYYSVGIVASIVIIRTILNYSLNRELQALSKEVS